MRLRVTKSKNTDIFYVIKTVYIKGKEKTIIVVGISIMTPTIPAIIPTILFTQI